MWYLAEILFDQPKQSDRRMYVCESCNVLLQAISADEAYDKAQAWAQDYIGSGTIEPLGISDLTSIGEEIGDGVEICGHYFQKLDVWDRKDTLIPAPDQLGAMQWEEDQDTPIEEMLDSHQLEMLRKRLESS